MYKVVVKQNQSNEEVLLAEFSVDSKGITDETGSGVEAVKSIPVIDSNTGDQLTSDTDPVGWAKNLPQAFRSGDMSVSVEEV